MKDALAWVTLACGVAATIFLGMAAYGVLPGQCSSVFKDQLQYCKKANRQSVESRITKAGA